MANSDGDMTNNIPSGTRSNDPGSFGALELLDALVKLVDANEEAGNGEEKPVKEERGCDEDRVPLALEHGLLVANVLRGRAAVLMLTGRQRLILPIYVSEEEETKGNHREHRLQGVSNHCEEPSPEEVQAREGKKK